MTTFDHFWTQRLPGNRLSIRGDVCGVKMATTDVHFSPRAIAGPKDFPTGETRSGPVKERSELNELRSKPLKEIANAQNHDVGVAGSGGPLFR
jgi:hypothetical protein